jgi:hypothetical protein
LASRQVVEERCTFLAPCRKSIVVYQATCLETGKKYIGNTQRHVKKRMSEHVGDTKRLYFNNTKSDSFAEHFCQFIPKGIPNTKEGKKEATKFIKVKVDILWQGNPLSCVKTFGTKACKLCAREKLAILKTSRKNPDKLINKNFEIYGACRHNPKFHRFGQLHNIAPNTDESIKDERVPTRPGSTTSLESAGSFDSTTAFNDTRESPVRYIDPDNCPELGYRTIMMNGLQARFQIDPEHHLEVKDNLEKPPQDQDSNPDEVADLPLSDALVDG